MEKRLKEFEVNVMKYRKIFNFIPIAILILFNIYFIHEYFIDNLIYKDYHLDLNVLTGLFICIAGWIIVLKFFDIKRFLKLFSIVNLLIIIIIIIIYVFPACKFLYWIIGQSGE